MFNYDIRNDKSLKEAIIHLVAFFDLFEYPLTGYEIWYYLDKPGQLSDLLKFLANDSPIIKQKNGFYFLAQREEIIITRQKRYNYTNRKLKIAKRFSYWFNLLPFIKTIAISNSIGAHNLREGSDIDFFIITSPNRIWLSRFLCAGLAKLLNRRPTKRNKQDKICLSFYITKDHLNLTDLKLPFNDPYFDYWIRSLILLYNKKGIYQQFLIANKLAKGELLPLKHPKNSLVDKLEKLTKKWQLQIMSPDLKKEMNNSDGVVVNDQVLKLYLGDRRREFLDKFNCKINEIFQKIN